ncbi:MULTISPECIES: DUF4142 domain-containing protein [unclassified Xanthomonas]|uniref:DUF4142 domain-containing protein n=1 Tax=unclassified Xanthomonas TaxID=2643310 RepID=UPI002882F3EF|nr:MULTISPECIES: DUF4142 domain-containing protein [unclassified Xanthomonas]
MGLFKMVTAGAVGYVAYRAWQRSQGLAANTQLEQGAREDRQTAQSAIGTPPHGDPLRTSVGDARDRQQALGALAIFNEQERTLAQLAVVKGVEGELLDFARKMDEAHSTALTDLSRFAPDRSGPLGQAASARSKSARDQLQALHGQAFETQYLQTAVRSHSQALELLDKQLSSEPGSSDLGKELQRTRETIAEHLDHAKALSAKQTQPH